MDFDFGELEAAELSGDHEACSADALIAQQSCEPDDPQEWCELMQRMQVYALAIPSRREHICALLAKWGFKSAIVVDGILSRTIILDDWAAMGRIKRNPDVTKGRVACHFGHRRILREFLDGAPEGKNLALVFEDDLMDLPTEEVQQGMLKFFRQVPVDFDILHLGFLWEDQSARKRVGTSNVYRTCKAVGRHAYVVTRRAASTLLVETYPQTRAGDQMNITAIRRYLSGAYQPARPIFFQDRGAFPISEITGHYRPARDFQPRQEEMRLWKQEVRGARKRDPDRGYQQLDEIMLAVAAEIQRQMGTPGSEGTKL